MTRGANLIYLVLQQEVRIKPHCQLWRCQKGWQLLTCVVHLTGNKRIFNKEKQSQQQK